MSGVRVDAAEFRRLPLAVHAFLADVPLHDVSAIDLPGGGAGRTIAEIRSLFDEEELSRSNTAVRALFALRRALGTLFRWDTDVGADHPALYVRRLPEHLRAASAVEPGTRAGAFAIVYQLERELLTEIRNATVHAFLCSVLQPIDGGYRLYWAVYVQPVSRLTPLYMALIEPFRRFVVYPTVLGRIRRAWIARFATAAG